MENWTAVGAAGAAVLAALVAIVAVLVARRQAARAAEQVKVAVDQANAAWDSARTAEKQADRAAREVKAAEQHLAASRAEFDERMTVQLDGQQAVHDEQVQPRNGSTVTAAPAEPPTAERDADPAQVVADIIADATAVVRTARQVLETTQPGRHFTADDITERRSAYDAATGRWGATVQRHITSTVPRLPFGEDVVGFFGAHLAFDRSLTELLSARKPSADLQEPQRARTGELLAAMEEPLHVVRESSAEWLALTTARYDPAAGLSELIMSATR